VLLLFSNCVVVVAGAVGCWLAAFVAAAVLMFLRVYVNRTMLAVGSDVNISSSIRSRCSCSCTACLDDAYFVSRPHPPHTHTQSTHTYMYSYIFTYVTYTLFFMHLLGSILIAFFFLQFSFYIFFAPLRNEKLYTAVEVPWLKRDSKSESGQCFF